MLLMITDSLEDSFEFVNANDTWNRTGQNLVWNIGKLAKEANETSYDIWVTVSALIIAALNNTAHVNSSEEETVKNSTEHINFYPEVILDINKTINIDVIHLNEDLVFTVNVVNIGPSNAINAKFMMGFEFASSNDSKYNSTTGELIIDLFKINGSYAFNITLKTITNGTLTNVANVTGN